MGDDDHVGSSSASGFRNVKPLTRAERHALHDKVALEKDRLMKRTGYEARMYRENAPKTSEGLITPEATAAGFLADADRFHSDTSGEEYLRRQARVESKAANYAHKRVERVQREEDRWDAIEARKREEEEYWEEQRHLGEKARKNHSSVPYDPLTLRYNDGLDGERLRFDDDNVRYRAAVRSRNLQRCGDTRAGYNIINGHNRDLLRVPPVPVPDPVLADHIDAIEAEAAAQRAIAYSNMLL